jgi:membrane associated rhomboid family serine protease
MNKFGKTTSIVVGVNVLIFLITMALPKEYLYQMGLTKDNIISFSLFTYLFVHANLFHLLMNMFALLQLGSNVERAISSTEFLKVYFITGIFSAIFSIPFLFMSNMVIVGASGAIFGIWAFYAYLTRDLKEFWITFLIFHVIIFLIGLPVAWFAHEGGSLAGFALAMYRKRKKGYLVYRIGDL